MLQQTSRTAVKAAALDALGGNYESKGIGSSNKLSIIASQRFCKIIKHTDTVILPHWLIKTKTNISQISTVQKEL